MSVCSQQMNGFQTILADIMLDGLLLLIVVGTTIDDDALLGLVTYHVAVLLQRVYHDSFNIEHCSLKLVGR